MNLLSNSQESERSKTAKNKLKKKSALLPAVVAAVFLLVASPLAYADRFDEQINKLRQQNSSSAAAKAKLADKEETLASKVASLQSSIAELSGQIQNQQAESDNLKREIIRIEKQLADERELLGHNIRQMYLEDDISMLEMLASSKNFSEYADKEQYLSSVKDKVKASLDKVNALKDRQETKKKKIDLILAEQKDRRAQLAKDQAEVSRLLSLNRGQQAAYNRDISANNSKIAKLRAEQAAINARGFVGGVSYAGGGSYPWAGVPFPNTISDPWGMYKRQCVSYTAWKVASTGRHMPYWGGRGNANLWDDNARRAGIAVGYTPRVGAVAVSNAGYYGHVMYVEKVYGDGTIYISQYNADWTGRYSEGRRSASGLVYIYF